MKLLLVLAVLSSVALAELPKPQPLDFNYRDLKNIWANPRLEPAVKRITSRSDIKRTIDQRGIVGGNPARLGQFPFHVLLVIDNLWWCGGILLHAHVVMTAGHCIYLSVTASAYSIVDLNVGYYWTSNSASLTVHENYDDNLLTNDIGIMRTLSPAPNNIYTTYINLPRQHIGNSFTGYNATIQGFGVYSDAVGDVSEVKNYVAQTIISNADCAIWGPFATELCTTTVGRRGPCNGDSGGGLFIGDENNHNPERVVVGIVSFGALAGCELEYPAVYTRVTEFIPWIEHHMN